MDKNKETLFTEILERCKDKESMLIDISYTKQCILDCKERCKVDSNANNDLFLFECTLIIQKECLKHYFH